MHQGLKFEFFVSIQVDSNKIKSGIHPSNIVSQTLMLNILFPVSNRAKHILLKNNYNVAYSSSNHIILCPGWLFNL